MESIFVPSDGFTFKAKIARLPGVHPGGVLTYRPAVPLVRLRYTEALGAAEKHEAACTLIGEQVVSFAPDAEGAKPARITAADAARLHPPFFNLVLNYVLGLQWPEGEKDPEGNSPGPSGS